MKADYYVYVYFRPDGSPCYVGKGRGRRWLVHLTRCLNPHLAAIINNAEGIIPIIKIRENLTNVQANEIEIALIKAIGRKCHGGPLVNQTDGGDGVAGRIMSTIERERRREILGRPEVRAKMSASHIGKPSSWKGRSPSIESRDKIRRSAIGRVQSEETIAKRVAKLRGLKRSPEHCAHQSAIRIGKKPNAEMKLKMSLAKKGKPLSPKHREAIRAALGDPAMRQILSDGGRLGAERRWRG